MFQHQLYPKTEMPVYRNASTTPTSIAATANGDSSPASFSTPLPTPGIHQPPAAVLAEISRTPPRSLVQVLAYQLLHEGEFKYIKNGMKFSVLDSVELINPVLLPARTPIPSRSIRFNMREVQGFTLIRTGPARKPPQINEKKKKPEIDPDQSVQLHLTTFVVRTAQQLKNFSQIIYDVEVCGVSFEGENVSRHGTVSWILLSAKKTLVPLDMISLTQEVPNPWETLKKCLFENRKLIKIFHDCRPAADYLFHKHDIKMTNVFDTQVADAFIVRNATGFHPAELKPLADVLQLYNARIPVEEIEYLRQFDKNDSKENNPWLVRPLPERQFLKYGALKVKHLVPLRDNVIKKMLERFTKAVGVQSEIHNLTDSMLQAQLVENPLAMPANLETILDEEPTGTG